MTSDHLELTVKKVVAQNRGVRVEDLALNTRLREDLGLEGDDVDELFEELSDRVGPIDLSTLEFFAYFHDEGWFSGWPWSRTKGNRQPKRPVTIQHLIEVARAGEWFDPRATTV